MLLGQIVAQLSATWADALVIYGPLGVGWIAGAYLIDKLMKLHAIREDKMEQRELTRDKLIREVMHEQAEAQKELAHRVYSVSKGLVYIAATLGHDSLKNLAEKELAKMEAKER